MLTLLLTAAFVVGCATGASPSSTPLASTSPAPPPATAEATFAPSPAPSTSASPGLGITWAPLSAGFDPHIPTSGLARLASGAYLVFGQALSIGGETSMAASSHDGSTWSLEAGLAPVADVTLFAAASLDVLGPVAGPAVAVGSRTDLAGTVTGVVYVKPSEAGWKKVQDQPSLAGANLHGVIATPRGFVAFGGYSGGTAATGCAGACPSGVGIWTSGDGETWTAVLRIAAKSASDLTLAGVVSGPGGLVAYGRTGLGPQSTSIWTSPDGRTWTAAHPTGLDGIGIRGIVAIGGTAFLGAGGTAGYLAVGTVEAAAPTVFHSADGTHWSAVATSPSLDGIIAVDGGFVGWDNLAFTTSDFVRASYGVWTSLDGTTWKHADAYENFYSGGMVASGGKVLSIGSNNDPNPLWIGTMTVVPSS
jgi:hypothetical protein